MKNELKFGLRQYKLENEIRGLIEEIWG